MSKKKNYTLYVNLFQISVLLEEIDDLRQGRSSRVKKLGGAESDSEMSISESIIVMNYLQ